MKWAPRALSERKTFTESQAFGAVRFSHRPVKTVD